MALTVSKPALLALAAALVVCLVLPSAASAQSRGDGDGEVERLNAAMMEQYKKGEYDEALKLAKRALDATAKASGEGSRPYANALFNVAALYEQKLKYDDAVTFYERAVSVYEKLPEADRPDLSRPLTKLAALRLAKRDYEKAEPLYQRAVALREKAAGLNDLRGAELLLQYACVLRLGKKETEAAAAETRALGVGLKENADQLDAVYLPGECLTLRKVELPFPRYPSRAKTERATGRVSVEVAIDETGKVTSARALNGHNLLQAASVEAAYKARFEPLAIGGRAVKMTGLLVYTFTAEIHGP